MPDKMTKVIIGGMVNHRIRLFLTGIARAQLTKNGALSRLVENAFLFDWYYRKDTWGKNTFLGYPICQCPLDMQLYQELIFQLRPEVIIQTGVLGGGSVLYFASILDMMDFDSNALVIGVDIELTEKAKTLQHSRIRLLEGSSTDAQIMDSIKSLTEGKTGLVFLDSDHKRDHVLNELKLYRDFVAIGSYLVVEDTCVNGHPLLPSFGPGPYEAVEQFLRLDNRFVRDDLWRRNRISFHPNGWLKRIR